MAGKPIHGLSSTPEYRAWQTARLRCTSSTAPAYADYGGRGIRMCQQWLESPERFVADMGPKPTPAHELDREDNSGHYEPNNCRWVLRKINDRNRRNNRRLEFNGETHALAEWCERFGLPRDTVKKRLDAGWTVEEALTIAVRQKAANGDAMPKTNWCVGCGLIRVWGERCRSCENRRRAATRANVVEQRQEAAA